MQIAYIFFGRYIALPDNADKIYGLGRGTTYSPVTRLWVHDRNWIPFDILPTLAKINTSNHM